MQSPPEFPFAHQRDRGFFSVRGGDGYSQPAFLHIKDRVGRVALRERRLVLFQIENFLAHPGSGEKGFSIEDCVAICRLRFGCLRLGRCRIQPEAGFADRAELTDEARLAGRPGHGLACLWRSFHTSDEKPEI